MATVIDELVQILGFEMAPNAGAIVDKFEKGLDKVTKVAGWASAALMATAGAVGAFVEKNARAAAHLEKFHKLTGMSTTTLQSWSYAVEKAGGNASDMEADLMGLTKSMSSPIPGEFNQALFMIGVNVRKANGELKGADDVLVEVSKKMQGMSKQEQIQWASKIGISDSTLLLLQKGPEAIAKYQKEAAAIPTIVSAELIKNAKEFVIQLTFLKRLMTYLGQTIAGTVAPMFKVIVKSFGDWLQLNKEWIQLKIKSVIDGIVDGFRHFYDVIGRVKKYFEDLTPAIMGAVDSLTSSNVISGMVYTVLIGIAAVLGVLIVKWILIGAAIMAVVAVIEDLFTFLEGGGSVFGDMVKWVTDLYSAFAEKFPAIAELIEMVGGFIVKMEKEWFKGLITGAKLVWEGLKMLADIFATLTISGLEFIDKVLKKLDLTKAGGWLGKMFGFGEDFAEGVNKIGSDALGTAKDFNRQATGPSVLASAHEFNRQATNPQASINTPQSANLGAGNSIKIEQHITGENAVGIASESGRKVSEALNTVAPGGFAPAAG